MSLVYRSTAERGRAWQALFAREEPELDFHLWPETGDPATVRYVCAWQPPDGMFERFPNLEVVFSVGAGVDQFDLRAFPAHVQLVRMLDPALQEGMVEYVCLAVLALHRDLPCYLHAQRERRWEPRKPARACERTVGVMGLGTMGEAALHALKPFGFRLRGWSRTARTIRDVETFAGTAQLGAFLSGCDILVCLLPLTAETRGILDRETLGALPRGAGLVSAGRGTQVDENALFALLDEGHLEGAVLDVLAQEPPPREHPVWSHARVLLTPHVAATTNPETAGLVLLDNIRRHRAGLPMNGVVDRMRGY